MEVIKTTNRTGTMIEFIPDETIFETTEFQTEILEKDLRNLLI